MIGNSRTLAIRCLTVAAALASAASATALVIPPPDIAPATKNWIVHGLTVLPYATDTLEGKDFGVHTAAPRGFTAATMDIEGGPMPYLRAANSTGGNHCFFYGCDGGVYFYNSSASGNLSYRFIITADSLEHSHELLDYMATIAPLRDDPYTPGAVWGLGLYDLKGGTFIDASQKIPSYYVGRDNGYAQVAVQTTPYGSPFLGDTGFSRACYNDPTNPLPCDAYDGDGNPVLVPFIAHTAVYYEGGLQFYGEVTLSAGVFGNAPGITEMFSNLAIIDPVLRLSAGFHGDPSHFILTLAPGIGNGVLPPPPGVPEPASWALLIAGFGLTGAAMRRRHPAVRPAIVSQ